MKLRLSAKLFSVSRLICVHASVGMLAHSIGAPTPLMRRRRQSKPTVNEDMKPSGSPVLASRRYWLGQSYACSESIHNQNEMVTISSMWGSSM